MVQMRDLKSADVKSISILLVMLLVLTACASKESWAVMARRPKAVLCDREELPSSTARTCDVFRDANDGTVLRTTRPRCHRDGARGNARARPSGADMDVPEDHGERWHNGSQNSLVSWDRVFRPFTGGLPHGRLVGGVPRSLTTGAFVQGIRSGSRLSTSPELDHGSTPAMLFLKSRKKAKEETLIWVDDLERLIRASIAGRRDSHIHGPGTGVSTHSEDGRERLGMRMTLHLRAKKSTRGRSPTHGADFADGTRERLHRVPEGDLVTRRDRIIGVFLGGEVSDVQAVAADYELHEKFLATAIENKISARGRHVRSRQV